jgi:hypothetical protein
MNADGTPEVFTQALQPNTPQPMQPQPLDAMAQLQAQYDALQQQINARGHRQVDPEQVKRAQARNDLDMQFGRLMMLTGDEGAQSVGGAVLKQAMSKQTPQVTERGAYNPLTQQWDYNPEYLNERDMAQQGALQGRMASVGEQRARDQSERQWREEQARLNREAAAERARTMAGAQASKLPNNTAQAVTSFGVMDKVLDQLEEELKTFDPRNPNDQLDTNKRARIDSLVSQYRLESKNAAELGALAGPDLGLIDDMMAPFTSARGIALGREGLLAQLKSTRQWGRTRRDQIQRMYPGANMGQEAPVAPLTNDMSDLTPTVALPKAVAASGARR